MCTYNYNRSQRDLMEDFLEDMEAQNDADAGTLQVIVIRITDIICVIFVYDTTRISLPSKDLKT